MLFEDSIPNLGFLLGCIHLIVTFIVAIVTTYGSFRMFNVLTKDINVNSELNSNNSAVGILLAGILLASLFAMKPVIDPVVSTFYAFSLSGMTVTAFGEFAIYSLAYLIGTIIITLLTFWFTIAVFLKLTKAIDELAEIKKGNTAVAIVLAMAIVVMGCFLGEGINGFLDGVIPLPNLSRGDISP